MLLSKKKKSNMRSIIITILVYNSTPFSGDIGASELRLCGVVLPPNAFPGIIKPSRFRGQADDNVKKDPEDTKADEKTSITSSDKRIYF